MLAACAPPPTQASPGAAADAVATPGPAATPTPAQAAAASHLEAFLPVAAFTSDRAQVSRSDLTEVLVPASVREAVAALLPGARLVVLPDGEVLPRVRASRDAVALVPAALVDPSVKTLAVEGRFYWDRSLDLASYPLAWKVPGGGAPPRRGALWELAMTGSVIFGRGVQERIERHGDPARPFARTRELLRAADLAVSTLESPLSGDANRPCERCMTFVGNERYATALRDAGYDVLSLASNHSGDAGTRGVLDTVRALGSLGIVSVGAGADLVAARRPALVGVGDVRVAFLAYTDVPPESYGATQTRPGNARLVHDDGYAQVRRDVADARAAAELVIVIAHWGIEYEDRPRPWIVAAAHAMVEAGADVVLGDHPHWVQSVELYRGAYIAYSTGNFVFDQMWSEETRQGAIHRLFFDGARLVSVRVLPTVIEDYHQPRLLAPDEPAYRATLSRMWRHSVFDGR